jgi:sugar phosphate isomerase/epimerase
MAWTRRELLAAGAGSLLGQIAPAEQPAVPRPRMGVVIHSYGIRRSADKERRFDDPLTFLDYCRTRGAGGVQTSLGVRDDAYAGRLRDFLATHQLYVEASISLPRDQADVERFSAEVRTAKRCGATLFRTVLMNGRRYEVFENAEAFRRFFEQGKQSLALARPVVEKLEVRMAVENHKDLQTAELLDLVKKIASPFVGVCIDTGNNLALLEAPQETVELLAPLAFTTHIKDMGVAEYADGFLLAEVPLGTGFVDLAKIIATVRKARPEIRLNLEMITRDPLNIPCLTPKYWATLERIPGRQLAEMLALVRSRAHKSLPRVSELTLEEQLKREDENVRQCLEYARTKLEA